MIILNGLLSSDSQPSNKESFYNYGAAAGGDFDGDTRTSLSVLSGIVVLFVSLAGENGGDKGSRKWLASLWQESLVRHLLWL